ncbi:MAG TPA: fibronectin type III domain-containing protein, partial [Thermoanaerobaculia bacterium]
DFLLGAFHSVKADGRHLAVRNLAAASEVTIGAGGVQKLQPGNDRQLRDFDAFARWVKARAAGPAPADYLLADPSGSLRSAIAKFTLFSDPDDLKNLRWFDFDTGGHVTWSASKDGEVGVQGGGYAELQAAQKAWNDDPGTPIDYRYAGTTSAHGGLQESDGINTILFNDPNGELDDFDCNTGGVLGLGGPWYQIALRTFRGKQYHAIAEGDVILNNGLACFFAQSPDASKAAAELLAHELGHSLGLGHSCGDSQSPDCSTSAAFDDAIMRAFVHDDGRGARLGSDDLAAVKSLYQLATGPNAPPAAPSALTAEGQSPTELHLSWTDNADNETGFRVELAPFGGAFAEVASLPANTTSTTLGGLTPATAYTVRVRAANANGFSDYSNEVSVATQGVVGPCLPDNQTLCLADGRVKVQVVGKTRTDSGAGSVISASSPDSGVFWFFAPDNWELVAKVLNGCALTHHYWVFFAAATDSQYTVTVTDSQTGAVKIYFNPLGNLPPAVADTIAFPVCPLP